MKILMVCLGNICRSPLADALLRKKVKENHLSIEVDSAGTSAFHLGKEPDARTQENAKTHGLDMQFLRARQFTKQDFIDFDYIFAMDNNNVYDIIQLAENDTDKSKVKLLLSQLETTTNQEVPDPYFGGADGFERVYQLLDKATDELIKNIVNQNL